MGRKRFCGDFSSMMPIPRGEGVLWPSLSEILTLEKTL
jgi:hypothetical protein